MATRPAHRRHFFGALIVAFAFPLYGCLLFIGTSPTPLSQANIIVIVRTDDSGDAVVGAAVRVAGTGAAELGRGITDSTGQYVSSVSGDVQDLRVVVDAPTGFVTSATRARSVEVSVPPGVERVTVLLTRDR